MLEEERLDPCTLEELEPTDDPVTFDGDEVTPQALAGKRSGGPFAQHSSCPRDPQVPASLEAGEPLGRLVPFGLVSRLAELQAPRERGPGLHLERGQQERAEDLRRPLVRIREGALVAGLDTGQDHGLGPRKF